MKHFFICKLTCILFYFFVSFSVLFGQSEKIKVVGTMNDTSGESLPGVAVVIEGTTEGTITDIDGNYAIEAPLGSTLVFSSIGMKTRRAIVTRTGLNPVGTRRIIPYNTVKESTRFVRDEELKAKEDSIAFANRMKHYRNYLADSLLLEKYKRVHASAIEGSKAKRKLRRFTDPDRDVFYRLGNIVVESNFLIEEVGRIPDLQSAYAQGRPIDGELSYQGPEVGELFSWGPPLRNLEYDGIANSFNENGSLVFKGTGNGKPSIYYNPKNIFQSGFSKSFGITTYQTIKGTKLDLTFRNRQSTGILPSEDCTKNNLRLKLKFPKLIKVNASYGHSEDNFKDGAIRSRILAYTYLTPVGFNKAYGLNTEDSNENIYLPDGLLPSSVLRSTNNPYFLTQYALDFRSSESFTHKISANPKWKSGDLYASISGEFYKNTRRIYLPDPFIQFGDDKNSKREERLTNLYLTANLKNNIIRRKLLLKAPFRAEFSDYQRDERYMGQNPNPVWRERQIITANPTIEHKGKREIYFVKFGMNTYASTTSDKSYYKPNISLYFRPFRFLDEVFYWDTEDIMDYFKFQFSYVTHINEYRLKNEAGLCNSLKYQVGEFFSYFENDEIEIPTGIVPEQNTKKDFTISNSFIYGRIRSETSFYSNTLKNGIFPLLENEQINYRNVGDIKTYGWEETLSAVILDGEFDWEAKLSLTKSKSKVTKLNSQGAIAVAGFKDVHTALIEGYAPGVIRGNSYLRNAEGNIIIGDHGFPLVNPSLSVIGDSNPDLLLGLSNTFNIVGMELGFTVDCTFGGDVWNGTQSTLDYYGVSQHTASLRNVSNYIFDGVKQDGSVNNIQVDFAPEDGDVLENRWIRYGTAGVAEDYIEDGTRIILSELYISYSFPNRLVNRWGLEKLSMSLSGNNLVTISGYRGNLSSNTLWGHSNTYGLDYFNTPPVRSYGVLLKITL
jgi:hypothetical protein